MKHGFHTLDCNGCQALATDRVDGAVGVFSMSELDFVGKSQSNDLACQLNSMAAMQRGSATGYKAAIGTSYLAGEKST
jgi:hypothetical protein